MTVVVSNGAARRMAVEPGDRVRAEGRFVHLDGDDWLDLAQINDMVLRSGPWTSSRSVRLRGADPSAVPSDGTAADRSLWPDHLRVVGRWHDDTIEVETQSPVPWPEQNEPEPLLTLPPPAGGWDVATRTTQLAGLEQLRASGTVVRDRWLQEDGGALILQVAATDISAVERVLGPQLPRRLCVAQSRCSAAQLREVEDTLSARAEQWGIEAWSLEGMDARCQPYADVVLTRISADLAAWAHTLPDGLLTLHPAMTPPD